MMTLEKLESSEASDRSMLAWARLSQHGECLHVTCMPRLPYNLTISFQAGKWLGNCILAFCHSALEVTQHHFPALAWSKCSQACPNSEAQQLLSEGKEAPQAAFPSWCFPAQTKRRTEGIRVPVPLAWGGSSTARVLLISGDHQGSHCD